MYSVLSFSLISVVFNRVLTVRGSMESLYAQTYRAWQHVVVDGASTDGTLAVVNSFPGEQRVLISEPDNGIYDALNKGMRLSTGEIIGVLHSDDFLADADVLKDVADAFADPTVDAVYGDLVYVSSSDPSRVVRYWRSCAFHPGLLVRGWMPPHPALFLRRRVVEAVGLYDTSFRIAADYDYILRCFSRPGFKAVHLPRVLVRMRLGGASNRSLTRILRKSREDLRALRKNRIGGWGTLLLKNLSKLGQFSVFHR